MQLASWLVMIVTFLSTALPFDADEPIHPMTEQLEITAHYVGAALMASVLTIYLESTMTNTMHYQAMIGLFFAYAFISKLHMKLWFQYRMSTFTLFNRLLMVGLLTSMMTILFNNKFNTAGYVVIGLVVLVILTTFTYEVQDTRKRNRVGRRRARARGRSRTVRTFGPPELYEVSSASSSSSSSSDTN